MNDWFRSWHGAPTDPKWLLIGRKANVPPAIVVAVFWALCDHASQQEDRGSVAAFDVETYAVFGGLEEEQAQSVIDALTEKGVIKDGRLAAWEKRQPKREDSSTERVRAHRERKVSVTPPTQLNETQCNATEREGTLDTEEIREDTDTDTEEIRGVNALAPAKPPRARPADLLFEQIVSECYGKSANDLTADERGRVNKATAQLRKLNTKPEDIHARAMEYRARSPDYPLTPQTLTKCWTDLGTPRPRASPSSNGRVFAGDLIADIRRREAMGER